VNPQPLLMSRRLLAGVCAVLGLAVPLVVSEALELRADPRGNAAGAATTKQPSPSARRPGVASEPIRTTGMTGTIRENTHTWFNADHSAWKALSNHPSGYVIAGTKFFEPNNLSLYISGFNDLCQHQWTVEHPTAKHGFTSLDTFWKSFTHLGPASNPSGFFIVVGGTRKGTRHYYSLLTNKNGQRVAEHFGPLSDGRQLGGVCQATDGGFVVVGGTNGGKVTIVKFNSLGELVTEVALPQDGFAWTVQPAPGGGYVIGSTNRRVTRVDTAFNVDWSVQATLPPSPDMSAYTYTEFEEILPLERTGPGFIQTGSAFSNSTSAVYTARFNWDGTVPWAKINDTANTSLAGTPVCWANSAVEYYNEPSDTFDILFTWRKGPVSAGGTLTYDRMHPPTGGSLQGGSLLNTIPVQEAFTVRQQFLDRIVIAGTRGGYSATYWYAASSLP
jgi:hypothetical protein